MYDVPPGVTARNMLTGSPQPCQRTRTGIGPLLACSSDSSTLAVLLAGRVQRPALQVAPSIISVAVVNDASAMNVMSVLAGSAPASSSVALSGEVPAAPARPAIP